MFFLPNHPFTTSYNMHHFCLFGHLKANFTLFSCSVWWHHHLSINRTVDANWPSVLCSCPTDQTGRGGAGVSDVGAAVRQVIVSGAAWWPQPGRTQQLPAAGPRQPGSHTHSLLFHTHGFHSFTHTCLLTTHTHRASLLEHMDLFRHQTISW